MNAVGYGMGTQVSHQWQTATGSLRAAGLLAADGRSLATGSPAGGR